jgi:hypothetical protein
MGRSGHHSSLMLHCTRSSTAADGTQRAHRQGAVATWQTCSWRGTVTSTPNIHVVVRSGIAFSNRHDFGVQAIGFYPESGDRLVALTNTYVHRPEELGKPCRRKAEASADKALRALWMLFALLATCQCDANTGEQVIFTTWLA